MIKGE